MEDAFILPAVSFPVMPVNIVAAKAIMEATKMRQNTFCSTVTAVRMTNTNKIK